MAEIVNLRQARKRKARAAEDQAARANRIAHGKPSSLRHLEEIEAKRLQVRHDGHRLTSDLDKADPK